MRGGPGHDRVQGGSGAVSVNGGIDVDVCAGKAVGQPNNPGDQLTAWSASEFSRARGIARRPVVR